MARSVDFFENPWILVLCADLIGLVFAIDSKTGVKKNPRIFFLSVPMDRFHFEDSTRKKLKSPVKNIEENLGQIPRKEKIGTK